MAGNLTAQVRNIATSPSRWQRGPLKEDHGRRRGEILQLKEAINVMSISFALCGRVIASRASRHRRQAQAPGGRARGRWHVERLDRIGECHGVRISRARCKATGSSRCPPPAAWPRGERKITVDVKGGSLSSRETINHDETVNGIRVGSEPGGAVGPEESSAPGAGAGVARTWKDLTDNVNSMRKNLTAQVRNIADVTTAVAKGRFVAARSRSMCAGKILELRTRSTRWSTVERLAPR